MGQSILIYIMGTLLLFLIVNMNLNRQLSDQSASSYNYYEELQTRNIGNSMVAMLISQISDSTNFRVTSAQTKTLFSGQATYTVRDTFMMPDSLIKISVSSAYMNQIKKMIVLIPKPSNTLPGVFQFSLISGGDMSLSGGTYFRSNNPNQNVNLKTNSRFSIGNNNLVKGFVGYGSSFSGDENKIQPVSNPNNLPVTAQSPNVDIPTFNPDDYKSEATQVYNGNYSIGNSINLGTKQNPSIIYVGGDLSISSGAQISGFIVFVVKGTISVQGNASFINTDPTVSNFAFYSVGNISIAGGATMYGQMLSLGNISFTGNSNLYGTAAAKGTMSFSGGTSTEVPAAKELTDPLWGAQGSIRPLVAKHYYE